MQQGMMDARSALETLEINKIMLEILKRQKKTGMGALAGAGNGGCAECTGKSEYTFFTTQLALETFCSPD